MNAGVLEGLGVEGALPGKLVALNVRPKEGRSWIGRTETGPRNGSGHCDKALLGGAIEMVRKDTTEGERRRCRGGADF